MADRNRPRARDQSASAVAQPAGSRNTCQAKKAHNYGSLMLQPPAVNMIRRKKRFRWTNLTASETLFVVPAEREARRAGTHTPQPLAGSVAMDPGSALASLAWPGRQWRGLVTQ